MRNTKQREEVLRVVLNSCDHPSAETVYLRAKERLPNISLGTVYRNLCQLVQMSTIRQIHTKDGADRFDKILTPHSHFHCKICLSLSDIDFDYSESNLCKEIIKNSSHSIEFVDINCSGICKACREKNEK